MKKAVFALAALFLMLCVSACGATDQMPPEAQQAESGHQEELPASTEDERKAASAENDDATEGETAMKMRIQIGGASFTATLEDNAAARALAEMMRQGPISIDLRDYAGFEKVGALERGLPAEDRQTTTAAGDIVLYNGDQIVLFYGSNSWSYTRLARVDDLSGWADALGSGDITAVLTIAEQG